MHWQRVLKLRFRLEFSTFLCLLASNSKKLLPRSTQLLSSGSSSVSLLERAAERTGRSEDYEGNVNAFLSGLPGCKCPNTVIHEVEIKRCRGRGEEVLQKLKNGRVRKGKFSRSKQSLPKRRRGKRGRKGKRGGVKK